MRDRRVTSLETWAKSVDSSISPDARLESVSDDASFRRYFRFVDAAPGRLLVDAPPEHEDSPSFLKISASMIAEGLNVPEVFAADLEQGYMMVSDLGDELYLDRIARVPEDTDRLYREAVQALIRMQRIQCDLPAYDEGRLLDEMNLFDEWFLARQLRIELSDELRNMLHRTYRMLVENALEQPACFVHRDYHGRNLMVVPSNPPGIIDFQDAVYGPITYDLVSLYKDCYHRFDRQQVEDAVATFHSELVATKVLSSDQPVLKWFDLMGAQRHLKCVGIFSRLNLRDGKSRYLPDIPLVVDYLIGVGDLYEEMADLGDWLRREIAPSLSGQEYTR